MTLGSNPNYNVTPTNGTLTITKKHLTVTADNKSKAYDGNPFTAFTVMITGFTCGDGVGVVSGSATYTGSAVGATLPGTYTITPQVGTLTATNYDFTPFVNGTLTIGYGTCTGSDPGGVILQPINADGSSIFPRSGRTVPVKFKVCDANGNPISDPTVVFAGTGGQLTMLSAVRGRARRLYRSLRAFSGEVPGALCAPSVILRAKHAGRFAVENATIQESRAVFRFNLIENRSSSPRSLQRV